MMGYRKLEPAEIESIRPTNMHIVRLKTVTNAIVCKLVNTNKERILPLGNFKSITDVITMGMSQDNIISIDVFRINRRCRVIIKERVYQDNLVVVGCYLK